MGTSLLFYQGMHEIIMIFEHLHNQQIDGYLSSQLGSGERLYIKGCGGCHGTMPAAVSTTPPKRTAAIVASATRIGGMRRNDGRLVTSSVISVTAPAATRRIPMIPMAARSREVRSPKIRLRSARTADAANSVAAAASIRLVQNLSATLTPCLDPKTTASAVG